MEDISWRQKSRQLWLKERDQNTGFFHRMANSYSRKNSKQKIKVDGVSLIEDVEIKQGIARAFQLQFTDPRSWHPSIMGIQFATLDRSEAANLEGIFTEEEVLEALMDMNGDKAPGPNGFTIAFWQSSWDVIRGEVMGMFRDLFAIGKVIRNLNSTFLVLIPKKGGAKDLIDFRPISLVGSLYKLLSKVLANRLKKVISKMVSPAQNAFVEGRQILDVSLIANEVIDSTLKNKDKGVMCKLDIEKAYNHLNWDFLLSVMDGMSFGMKSID